MKLKTKLTSTQLPVPSSHTIYCIHTAASFSRSGKECGEICKRCAWIKNIRQASHLNIRRISGDSRSGASIAV